MRRLPLLPLHPGAVLQPQTQHPAQLKTAAPPVNQPTCSASSCCSNCSTSCCAACGHSARLRPAAASRAATCTRHGHGSCQQAASDVHTSYVITYMQRPSTLLVRISTCQLRKICNRTVRCAQHAGTVSPAAVQPHSELPHTMQTPQRARTSHLLRNCCLRLSCCCCGQLSRSARCCALCRGVTQPGLQGRHQRS
jgi:hypothetical protein